MVRRHLAITGQVKATLNAGIEPNMPDFGGNAEREVRVGSVPGIISRRHHDGIPTTELFVRVIIIITVRTRAYGL